MMKFALAVICTIAAAAYAADKPSINPNLPTLFLIGDSTVNNPTKGLQGWGTPIADLFDKSRINVVNRARGGRSSRTYRTEGLWDQVLSELKPGDFVLMQFGHNDGGSLSDPKNRASIKGMGDETKEVADPKTGKKESVHSYGWYMRHYISEAKAKGATPIILSPVPRNRWKDGKVLRASSDYGKWAAESAKLENAFFVDLNEIVATRYESQGQEKVKTDYFTATDHTHTTPSGAKLNAESVVDGLKTLPDCKLKEYLK